MTDTEAVESVVAQIDDDFGQIDVLINNAGVRYISPFLETDIGSWQRTIDINLTGPFLCSQAVIPSMLRVGKGKIINIASTSGILAVTQRSAYCASKAGLLGLTRAMAFELSSQNILVNAIAPGPTETPMNDGYFTDPKRDTTRDMGSAGTPGRGGGVPRVGRLRSCVWSYDRSRRGLVGRQGILIGLDRVSERTLRALSEWEGSIVVVSAKDPNIAMYLWFWEWTRFDVRGKPLFPRVL